MSGRARQIGRLAMRVEGNLWVAYYARTETMEGAIFLGSVQMAGVATPERREAFMALMREVVSDILEGATGVRPRWSEPGRCPQHERAGRA